MRKGKVMSNEIPPVSPSDDRVFRVNIMLKIDTMEMVEKMEALIAAALGEVQPRTRVMRWCIKQAYEHAVVEGKFTPPAPDDY
jgi:hypothetical protein